VSVIGHALQARAATIDRCACAANLPLLLYLACLTALVGLFASIVYGQMQPTVIANAGPAGYREPAPENLFLHKPGTVEVSAEEMERAAIDAAEAENTDQGLLAFAAADLAAEQPKWSPVETAAAPQASQAKPKQKRVAKQHVVSDPWRSSWSSPRHSWERDGRWGGRPLWGSDDGF